MIGWIYCITNSLYKIDDMYKLGYTSNKNPHQLVKQHLIQRYGTYFPDVECIDLFEVKQPIQAEKQLFEFLKDYKHNNEIYKANYEITIKPQLEAIKKLYCCNNDRIFTEQEKQKEPLDKFTCLCGRVYTYRQGLHVHMKKCYRTDGYVARMPSKSDELQILAKLVTELVKSNKELVKQNQEAITQNREAITQNHNQMLEIVKMRLTYTFGH
jgi:hypothetical protein